MKRICETCYYWKLICELEETNYSWGHCHAKSPIVISNDKLTPVTRFPETGWDDFCGDWLSKYWEYEMTKSGRLKEEGSRR